MNQQEIALLARRHWERFLPTRYSQIEDPDSYFSTLGQEAEEEIDQLTQELAGDDPVGEDYLTKVGRLNAARQQAREQVLAERILLPAEPGSPMDETAGESDLPPSERTTGWIPVREDPSDPWWQEQETTS